MTTKAHTRYRTKAGMIVPGVTTVIGILAKPALIYWAWNLGMQGDDYRKVRDRAADIGTVTHYMVECAISNMTPELGDFTPNVVRAAKVAFKGFEEWRKTYDPKTLACEVELISEKYLYGGKLDWVARDKAGKVLLLDVKTSKGIYDEHKYQLAAYWRAWDETHPDTPIDEAAIIKLDKINGELSFHLFPNLDREFEIFVYLRDLYSLMKSGDKKRTRHQAYNRVIGRYLADQEKGGS